MKTYSSLAYLDIKFNVNMTAAMKLKDACALEEKL